MKIDPSPTPYQAINTTLDLTTTDASHEIEHLLQHTVHQLNNSFIPEEIIWKSDYFGTGRVGSFHCRGTYQNQPAVLKIQAAQPIKSEVWMINRFAKQNKSQIIRPPQIFANLPWNNDCGYQAIVFEYITGEKIINNQKKATNNHIQNFLQLYIEYRHNCLNQPWLPKNKPNYQKEFQSLLKLSNKIKPDHPLRLDSDKIISKKANIALMKVWKNASLEFQHGHFSTEDLIKKNQHVILFSNLFWKWKTPYYDAVFAYHWFMISQATNTTLKPSEFDKQKRLWLDNIFNLSIIKTSFDHSLLKAAFLERAVAGLLIDIPAYINSSLPLSQHIFTTTRKEIINLTQELEKNHSKAV